MIKLDMGLIRELSFTPKQPASINISLQDLLFNNSDLVYSDLSAALLSCSTKSSLIEQANANADTAESEEVNLNFIQMSILPSTLYLILKNDVEFIDFTISNEPDAINIFVCEINFTNISNTDSESALVISLLAALSLDQEKPQILSERVYNELLKYKDYLKIKTLKKYSFKRLVVEFPLIQDNKTALSLTKQSRINDDIRSILTFKANSNTSDFLQLFLINQQLKHSVFQILKPYIPLFHHRIKHNGFNLTSKSGELNVNLYYDGDSEYKPLLIECIKRLILFGILITNANQLGFRFNDPLLSESIESQSFEFPELTQDLLHAQMTVSNKLGLNDYNYILFRLLGTDHKETIRIFDDLVLAESDQEILNMIARVF